MPSRTCCFLECRTELFRRSPWTQPRSHPHPHHSFDFERHHAAEHFHCIVMWIRLYNLKRKVTPAQFCRLCWGGGSLWWLGVALSCLPSKIACIIISKKYFVCTQYTLALVWRSEAKNHDNTQWTNASQMTWWWHTLAFWYDSTMALKLIFPFWARFSVLHCMRFLFRFTWIHCRRE